MNQSEFQVGVIRPIECVKEAFELIKADYWLLFAVTLVGALIGGMTMYILLGAMMCGMFYCYLERIDGKTGGLRRTLEGVSVVASGLDRRLGDDRSDDHRLCGSLSSDHRGGRNGLEIERRRK
ncbi:MAG: hypothetical protein IPJ30_05225 [Acidobacteria bacterium]|nr:hypothetical protein [Acidobacteriota bacterium]